MIPLDWQYITDVEFTSHRVDLEATIPPIVLRTLLRFLARDKKGWSIRYEALVVEAIQGILAKPFSCRHPGS